MFTKILTIAVMGLTLGACGFTEAGDQLRERIIERGRDVQNQSLENSEDFVCKIASIEVIRQRYGTTEKRAKEYRDFCRDQEDFDILGVGEE